MQYKQCTAACSMRVWPFANSSLINSAAFSRSQCVRIFLAPAPPLFFDSRLFLDEKQKIKKQLPYMRVSPIPTSKLRRRAVIM